MVAKVEKASNGDDGFNRSRYEILLKFYAPAQRSISLVVGPIVVLMSLALLLTDPIWQFGVNMGSAIVLQALFVVSYVSIRKGDIHRSAILTTLAVALFGLVATVMIKGVLPVLLMAGIASAIRVSLLSRRFTLIFVLSLGVAYGLIAWVHYLEPFEILELSPLKELVLISGLVFFMVLLGLRYLLQLHQINEALFERMEISVASSDRMIEAVHRIHPIMEKATAEIEQISSGFASQASEQAAATTEVNATVGEVEQIAQRTVATAGDAEGASDQARSSMVDNSRRLKELVMGFERAVEGIEVSRTDITDLSNEIDRIEGIMEANREVGEQIKVLAVNASIEAASAGERGAGFAVVASELRDLIRITDDNILNSNEILRQIRERSRGSAESIRVGAEELLRYYGDLRTMGDLIEESAATLLEASRNVNQIAVSAREQQAGMREVSATMAQIDAAAGQLSESAARLSSVVARLTDSREDLSTVLTGGV